MAEPLNIAITITAVDEAQSVLDEVIATAEDVGKAFSDSAVGVLAFGKSVTRIMVVAQSAVGPLEELTRVMQEEGPAALMVREMLTGLSEEFGKVSQAVADYTSVIEQSSERVDAATTTTVSAFAGVAKAADGTAAQLELLGAQEEETGRKAATLGDLLAAANQKAVLATKSALTGVKEMNMEVDEAVVSARELTAEWNLATRNANTLIRVLKSGEMSTNDMNAAVDSLTESLGILPEAESAAITQTDAYALAIANATGEMVAMAVQARQLAATWGATAADAKVLIRAINSGALSEQQMTAATAELEAAIRKLPAAEAEAITGLDAYKTAVGETIAEEDAAVKATDRQKTSMMGMHGAGVNATLALAVVGYESLKMSGRFQQSVAQIEASGQMTKAQAQAIGNAFLGTAGHVIYSADEIGNAFGAVVGEFKTMGINAQSTSSDMTIMAAAMNLATSTGGGLAGSTKDIANAMMVFGGNAQSAAGYANTMFLTSRALGISADALSASFSRLLPFVAGSGMKFSEFSALMVELGKVTGAGSHSMWQVGSALQSLISPSTAGATAMAELGVKTRDASGKMLPMATIINEFHRSLSKLPATATSVAAAQKMLADQQTLSSLKIETQTKAIKKQESALSSQISGLKGQADAFSQASVMQAIFSKNAGIMAAIIAGGAAEFGKYQNQVSQAGAVEQAAAEQTNTFQGETKKLWAQVKDLAIVIGGDLAPVMQNVEAVVIAVVGGFMSLVQSTGPLLGILGGVAIGMLALGGAIKAVNSTINIGKGLWDFYSTAFKRAGDGISWTTGKYQSLTSSMAANSAATEEAVVQEIQLDAATQQVYDGLQAESIAIDEDAAAKIRGTMANSAFSASQADVAASTEATTAALSTTTAETTAMGGAISDIGAGAAGGPIGMIAALGIAVGAVAIPMIAGSSSAESYAQAMNDVRQAASSADSAMNSLASGVIGTQQAQAQAAQSGQQVAAAQRAYNQAVRSFGSSSPQAISAENQLHQAQLGHAQALVQVSQSQQQVVSQTQALSSAAQKLLTGQQNVNNAYSAQKQKMDLVNMSAAQQSAALDALQSKYGVSTSAVSDFHNQLVTMANEMIAAGGPSQKIGDELLYISQQNPEKAIQTLASGFGTITTTQALLALLQNQIDAMHGKTIALNVVSNVASGVAAAVGALGSGLGGASKHIKGHATGGLINSPELALIGEAGPELIIPMNQMPGGSAVVDGSHVTPITYGSPASAGGGGNNIYITVQMQGAVYGNLNQFSADLGRFLATKALPNAGVPLTVR